MMNSKIRIRLACFISIASLALSLISEEAKAQRPPDHEYFVYLVCESADQIAVVRFGPEGASIDHHLHTGMMPADINGPHGLVFSPDKKTYFVSLGHGRPFGTALKYRTSDDSVIGQVTLGLFPATMDVSPDGNFLYVVNFNLHGDMVPSSVSIVDTGSMVEVARVKTCTMPHGSRINPQGTHQYSACMMDDMLVEIDTGSLKVSRHFVVTRGKEIGMTGSPDTHRDATSMKEMPGHGDAPALGDDSCSPTWAQPSSDGSSVFVACNKSSEIVQIDTAIWQLVRRIPAAPGVYTPVVPTHRRLRPASN